MMVLPGFLVTPANTATCSRPLSALKANFVNRFMLKSVKAGIAKLSDAYEFTCGCTTEAWGWKKKSTVKSTVTRTVTAVPKCDTHRPMPKPGTFTHRITANNPIVNTAINVWLSSIHAACDPRP